MDLRVRRNAKILDRVGREITLENGTKLFVISSAISSNAEDSYATRMGQTSLDLFVQQANAEVPVCPNHTKEVITGYTSNASIDDQGIVSCDLNIDVDLDYAHPEAGYPNSDVLIRQLKNNRIKMTSIGGGFSDKTELRCNVDSKDMLSDMSCEHWPGVKYDVKVKESESSDKLVEKNIKCVPSWENLDLCEVSTVYAGANPDANIMMNRANIMLENGLLKKSVASRLNHFYGLSIDLSRAKPDKTIVDLGANNTGDNKMPLSEEEIQQLQKDKADAEARATQAEADKKKAEQERDAAQGDSAQLQQEKEDIKKECVTAYKEFRGDNLTGSDLTDFESTLESMTLAQMKIQRSILTGKAEEKEEEGRDDGNQRVSAGRTTTDKDKSKREDDEEYTNRHGTVLPPWFNMSKAKNVVP